MWKQTNKGISELKQSYVQRQGMCQDRKDSNRNLTENIKKGINNLELELYEKLDQVRTDYNNN